MGLYFGRLNITAKIDISEYKIKNPKKIENQLFRVYACG